MASLQDIRHRSKSIKSIQQITKAMKVVASARMRRAKEAATANKPYAQKMYDVINEVAGSSTNISHPLLEEHGNGRTLFIVIASDKGLAGAYASNVFKETKIHIEGTTESQNFLLEQEKAADKATSDGQGKASFLKKAALKTVKKDNLDLICIGRKTVEHFKHGSYNIIDSYVGFTEKPNYENARTIAMKIIELFSSGKYKNIYLIYTRFISALSAVPEIVKLLPFSGENTKTAAVPHAEYIYEPSAEAVLGYLLPQYFVTIMYAALLQAAASELSSRRTAMSNATDNAQDLMSSLDLYYNKVRQADITREITEIVGGAEALK